MTIPRDALLLEERPPVIKWFRWYCAVLAVVYLGLAAFSLVIIVIGPTEEMSRGEALVIGGVLLIMGLVLMGAAILPLVVRPQPWLWTYDLVIICLGMTSACFLPACIPLLIYWIRPETKSYFGKA